MITTNARTTLDPIMDAADKLPATSPEADRDDDARPESAFGLRFAISPPGMGEHEKTYYTVQVDESTTISNDGTDVTITDSVEKERED